MFRICMPCSGIYFPFYLYRYFRDNERPVQYEYIIKLGGQHVNFTKENKYLILHAIVNFKLRKQRHDIWCRFLGIISETTNFNINEKLICRAFAMICSIIEIIIIITISYIARNLVPYKPWELNNSKFEIGFSWKYLGLGLI